MPEVRCPKCEKLTERVTVCCECGGASGSWEKKDQAKCRYCHSNGRKCHRCHRRMQSDITILVNKLENAMLAPDQTDTVGITNHLRSVWAFRDALNGYFDQHQVEQCSGLGLEP